MKKNKILVLQGLPASGKTTYAKQLTELDKSWVIVSRDSIRESTGVYWVPEREDYISELEVFNIKAAIKANLNVIIDATNLNPKTINKWKDLAKELEVSLEFKHFAVDLDEAIRRDKQREIDGKRSVGEKVIKDFYKKYISNSNKIQHINREYLQQDPTLPRAVIVDIDGTIALMNGRGAFDWSKVNTDLPNTPMINLIHGLHPHIKVIFLSGREGTEECRLKTEQWLNKYFKLPYGYELYMREEGNYEPDEIVKRRLFNTHVYNNYNVMCVFDDRNKVVNMWRKIGLLCLQVEEGNF